MYLSNPAIQSETGKLPKSKKKRNPEKKLNVYEKCEIVQIF